MVPVRIQRANSGFSTGTCIACDSEPVTPTGPAACDRSLRLGGPHVGRTATVPGKQPMTHVHDVLCSLCSFLQKKNEEEEEQCELMS
jgi:hypothetical protein